MRTIYWVFVVLVLWGGLYMLFGRGGTASVIEDDVAPGQGVSIIGEVVEIDVPEGNADAPGDGATGDDAGLALSTGTSEIGETAEIPEIPTGANPADPMLLQGDPVSPGKPSGSGDPAADATAKMTVVQEPELRDGVVHVSFDYLAAYPFDEPKGQAGRGKPSYKSQVPARIYELDGKVVSVEGYLIPLKGLGTRVFQFYLARHNGTCCFGQPLNINDVVEVFVKDDKGSPHFYNRVRAQGKFEVGEGYDEEGYLINVYRMRADIVEEAEEQ